MPTAPGTKSRRRRDLPPSGDGHTTPERAALCEAIAPLVVVLRDGAWRAVNRRPEADASGETLAMARHLLGEARRLLRREPDEQRLDGLRFRPPLKLFDLALRVSHIDEALRAFRGRYYGWHPVLKRPGWHLLDDRSVEAARRLEPRSLDMLPADDAAAARRAAEARETVARLIEARAAELARTGGKLDIDRIPLPGDK